MPSTRTVMVSEILESRWTSFYKRIGGKGDPSIVWAALFQEYSGRPYHNLEHIRACLTELDEVKDRIRDPKAVEFALWFHDAVYDSKAKDNEERSAEWAHRAVLLAGLDKNFADRIRELILITKEHMPSGTDTDAQYMTDIDISVLGKPPEEFSTYNNAIRKEYSWVSESDYKQGRAAILKKLGGQPGKKIYSTKEFEQKYGAQAKKNIAGALKDLEGEKAVYAGSFDPPTLGHMWMITKGAELFDELIVAVAVNPEKKTAFTLEERKAMLKEMTSHLKNVKIASFENVYSARFAKEQGAQYLLRGIRGPLDEEYERTIEMVNRDIEETVETKFLRPPPSVAIISSSLVKGLIGPEGWQDVIKKYVPEGVHKILLRKYGAR